MTGDITPSVPLKRKFRYVALLSWLLAVVVALPAEDASAQGLLGSLLRGVHQPSRSSTPWPSNYNQEQTVSPLTIILRLEKGAWVFQNQNSFGDPVALSVCQAALTPEDQHRLMSIMRGYKNDPATNLPPHAFVMKSNSETNSPEWKIGLIVCDRNTAYVNNGAPASDILVSHGMDPEALLGAANTFIRETDGSFPPPPTPAELAQAKLNQKYFIQMIIYSASGEMVQGNADEFNMFDTAAECDKNVESRIRGTFLKTLGGARRIGTSVVYDTDGSGWVWIGCLHPSELDAPQFSKYFDTKMTPERAKQMVRFPDLLHMGQGQQQQPQQAKTPQQSRQVKF